MLPDDTTALAVEPNLDVAMVLPEDECGTVNVLAPDGAAAYLDGAGKRIPLAPGAPVSIHATQSEVSASLNGETVLQSDSLEISPQEEAAASRNNVLTLQNVVAGRGFHWKKHIDVSVFGSLRFSSRDGRLVVINSLGFEAYVMCVATSEMSPACPAALIEAQTIAARSWMLANVERKHAALGADVCNDDCCQRYQGTGALTDAAAAGAARTRGRILWHEGAICDARYSKSCGGMMEAFSTAWPGADVPYLRVKFDGPDPEAPGIDLREESAFREWLAAPPAAFCSPAAVPEEDLLNYLGSVDEHGSYYRWRFGYSQEELTALLNDKLDLDATEINALEPLVRGGSGRLASLRIHYTTARGTREEKRLDSEYAIREALHAGFLYSSAIAIDAEPPQSTAPAKFHLQGGGWGHGVGLCQIGALGMALAGRPADEILLHYYPGAALKQLYT